MWYGLQDVEVWRRMPASGNWGVPQPTYHHTIRDVTIQPFSSNEAVRSGQAFANVISLFTCDIEEDIKNGDELILGDGSTLRVQVAEAWNAGILPHWEVYLTYSQWARQ